jgi:hypothetical protein
LLLLILDAEKRKREEKRQAGFDWFEARYLLTMWCAAAC